MITAQEASKITARSFPVLAAQLSSEIRQRALEGYNSVGVPNAPGLVTYLEGLGYIVKADDCGYLDVSW